MSIQPEATTRLVHGPVSGAGSVLGPLLAGEHDPRLYPALLEWCVQHHPVPEAIVRLIADLTALDDESPVLARLSVLATPTAEAIQALAHWESRWHVLDERWTAACLRWHRGEPRSEDDAVLLGELLERSPFTRIIHLAVQRHPTVARRALRIAYEASAYRPVDRVVLEAWTGAFATIAQ
jgi:hypothetical protein